MTEERELIPDEIFLSVRQNWGSYQFEVLVAGYMRPTQDDVEMMEAHVTFDEPGSRYRRLPPTMFISEQAIQRLFDELWGLGLRPSRGLSVEDELKIVNKHLEDMRQIAFDRLKVEKP